MFEMITRIYNLAGTHKPKIIKGIIFNCLKALFQVSMMLGVFYVLVNLDDLSMNIILGAFAITLVSLLGRFFFQWMYDKTMSGAGYDIFRDYRLEIGKKLKMAPMGYFSEKNLGCIQNILTTAVADLEGYSMLAIEQLTSGIAMSVIMAFMMFGFNPVIAIISIVGILLSFIPLRAIKTLSAKHSPILFEATKTMIGKVIEYIQGITVLRLFAQESQDLVGLDKSLEDKRIADFNQEKATAAPLRVYMLSFKLISCILIGVAVALYLNGAFSISYCLTFLVFSFMVYADTEMLGNSAFLSQRINNELDQLETINNMPCMNYKETTLHLEAFDIELNNVTFSYDERLIINDISFRIPQGSSCAIVGPSGSGKTTLCNLVARFWDPQHGSVTIGGKNIKDYNPDSILDYISMVFQDVYLFNTTIETNIKFGMQNATHEQVVAAAQKAHCHEFIMELPEGYDTVIGEGGTTLSGGEKQRISIARAILKNAPIIIFDEATSSVDPENEKLILEALHELTKDKTVLTIAHRLETIKDADQIIVLTGGRIIQKGTHQELIKEEGTYKNYISIRESASSWTL